jgi:hypothetical protein
MCIKFKIFQKRSPLPAGAKPGGMQGFFIESIQVKLQRLYSITFFSYHPLHCEKSCMMLRAIAFLHSTGHWARSETFLQCPSHVGLPNLTSMNVLPLYSDKKASTSTARVVLHRLPSKT